MVLNLAHHLMMLYICTKFRKKYLKGFQSFAADAISKLKFSKGNNSIKKINGVMVLVFCTLPD